MNIDILNAYCGLGHSRGHARLRVGLQYQSRAARTFARAVDVAAVALLVRVGRIFAASSSAVVCRLRRRRRRRTGRPPGRRVVSNSELTPLLECAVVAVSAPVACSILSAAERRRLRGETVARSYNRRRRRVDRRRRRGRPRLRRRGVVTVILLSFFFDLRSDEITR